MPRSSWSWLRRATTARITTPNRAFPDRTGTSMATPHVSGAAALVLAGCSLNTAALRNTLLSNVDPLPGLTGMVSSGGRLNVDRAIRNCGAPAAPALSGVQLTPAQTVGGAATAQNQVVLTAAAPQGGITVQLSSSNPALASVPATVVVPAGATTAAFTIQTSAVATATPVTISAFYLGVTRSGT